MTDKDKNITILKAENTAPLKAELDKLKENQEISDADLDGISGGGGASALPSYGDASASPNRRRGG